MECGICSRSNFETIGIYCASCARSVMYIPRLEAARTLLEKQTLGSQIDTISSGIVGQTPSGKVQTFQAAWTAETKRVQYSVLNDRIREQKLETVTLREDIAKMKIEIEQKRRELALKKSDLDRIKNQTAPRHQKRLDKLSDIGRKGTLSFDSTHHESVELKIHLCRTAATLLRMKQKRRMKSGVMREYYFIAGLIIPDLREINTIRCADLTAVLSSVSHLLVLVAFYLGIRLPAEITLPHRDYPLPTINTPATSYSGVRIPFPGSGSALSIPSSPTSSRHDIRVLSRPRPLFIGSDDREEKISQFAKRDQAAFNFFLEAISLLAWNISWLVQVQGFSVGTETWEDACQIGRNLWQLLFGSSPSIPIPKSLSNRDLRQRVTRQNDTSSPSPSPNVIGKLGEQSHSSAHSFLGGAAKKDNARGWKMTQYTMIADPLKRTLLTEMNNAEWELLEEQEVDDGGERFDDAEFIKVRPTDGREYDDARSILTLRTHMGEVEDIPNTNNARARGTSGWTKLKNRENPIND